MYNPKACVILAEKRDLVLKSMLDMKGSMCILGRTACHNRPTVIEWVDEVIIMRGILINELGLPENALYSTAMDDMSIRSVTEDTMILHLFQHTGINMGLDDVRIPEFRHGLDYYGSKQQTVTLRNSGGRSVVADEGVLNMSLIYCSKASMHENYTAYADFIKESLSPFTTEIKTGEIKGAYCPGNSDMSISGKKFCGTAQRKVKDAVAMVCYISINGNQQQRGKLVQGFYDACRFQDVSVDPEAMESLDTLTSLELSVADVARQIIATFKARVSRLDCNQTWDIQTEAFQSSLKRTQAQNERYLSMEKV